MRQETGTRVDDFAPTLSIEFAHGPIEKGGLAHLVVGMLLPTGSKLYASQGLVRERLSRGFEMFWA